RRLNSPNDVVVKSDGSVWFSDPTFGIRGYYEGEKAQPELPGRVYRVDPGTGAVSPVTDRLSLPNGLAFSPDESVLYVVESDPQRRGIHAFDVTGGGRELDGGRLLI